MSFISLQHPSIICTCGTVIPNENIAYWNGHDEEGEDCGVVEVRCGKCNTTFESSQWGEWENEAEALENIAEYINGHNA